MGLSPTFGGGPGWSSAWDRMRGAMPYSGGGGGGGGGSTVSSGVAERRNGAQVGGGQHARAAAQPATVPGPPASNGGMFGTLDPAGMFGTLMDPTSAGRYQANGPFNPVNKYDKPGAGLYGLPPAYAGWSAPARNSLFPTLLFSQQAEPAIAALKGQMNKDWTGELYNQSADIIDTQQQAAKREGEQRLARAGYGGGGTISPFAGLQVQQENLARSGQLGNAARMSIMQGQQMKAEATRSYLNSIAQNMQALLTPAQLEVSRQAKVPIGGGVSLIGPALNAAAAGIGAFAGA